MNEAAVASKTGKGPGLDLINISAPPQGHFCKLVCVHARTRTHTDTRSFQGEKKKIIMTIIKGRDVYFLLGSLPPADSANLDRRRRNSSL